MIKRVLTVVLSVVFLCSFIQTGLAEGEAPQPAETPQTTEAPQTTQLPQPTETTLETAQPTETSEPVPTVPPTTEPTTEPEPTIAAGTVMQPASDDRTPPVLTGVTLNATSFNRGDTLTVTVLATELESGFDLSRCYLHYVGQHPTDPNMSVDDFIVKLDTLCEGGIGVQGSIVLNERVGATYWLESVRLTDNNSNKIFYCRFEGTVPEAGFTLVSDYVKPPYPQPPTLTISGCSVSATTARVGDTINYTISVSDPTGIVSASMELADMCPRWNRKVYNVPLNLVDGTFYTYSASFTVPPDMYEETYYPLFYFRKGSGEYVRLYWNDFYPTYGNINLKVINPNVKPSDDYPELQSYSMSSHNLTYGQTLTVTVNIDPKYTMVTGVNAAFYKKENYFIQDKEQLGIAKLSNMGNGVYSGTLKIPFNVSPGVYSVSWIEAVTAENSVWIRLPESFCVYDSQGQRYLRDGDVTVCSPLSVSGTDNRTIMVGEAFDALKGVTASNAYTGDVTNKMTVTGGAIDTSVPGMYLIKYIINDMVTVDGISSPVKYTDYRWIGVTELIPEGPLPTGEMPLALTDGNMAIGAESTDASIKKDGNSIPFSNVVTEPGNYTLTTGGASMAAGAVANAEDVMETMSAGGGSQESAAAIIDRSGPAFKAAWQKTGRTGLTVSIKASDISGVAELKFKAGSCSVEDCRANGTAFAGSFGIPGYGLYTVYTRDKLGNESVSVLNINTPYSSNSAFIENVYLSAGSLSRAFSRTTTSYKVMLGEGEGSFTITPVKEFDDAAMTINGKAVPSYTVSLANGKSAKISVKVRYGKASKTYTFTVTRAKSTNNALSSLGASAGTWSQPFDPNVTNYTLSLDENTKSVNITDTAASPFARASFKAKKITLNNGQSKKVTLTVKAQSGAKRTYTITVVRAASSNADLKSLKVRGEGCALTPAFSAGQTNYTVVMPVSAAASSSVTISAAPAGYKAKVSAGGTRRASVKVTLAAGQSASLQVVVTSQSGAAKVYTITVTRP